MIETLRGSATTPSYLSDTTPRLVRNRPVSYIPWRPVRKLAVHPSVRETSFGHPFRMDLAMPRVHPGQTTDNQLGKIAAAGFGIEPRRIVTETVSGSVAAVQRRGFTRLRPPRARRRAGGHRARPARPRRPGPGVHRGPPPPRTGSRRLVTGGPCSIAGTVPTISTITRPID